mgnify:CR=1 FL=1
MLWAPLFVETDMKKESKNSNRMKKICDNQSN